MPDESITLALRHLASTPTPSLTPPDLAEVRRVATRVAFELWSGRPEDRPAIITAFVEMYGTQPQVQSILHDRLADRARTSRHTFRLHRHNARMIRSTNHEGL